MTDTTSQHVVVGGRSRLPAVPAIVRRQQRRRHRRLRGDPQPPRSSARPRRRRHLVVAVLPVAAGRSRLRRRRLLRHRAEVRHARRLRPHVGRGQGTRHPHPARHRAEPLQLRSRLVPGGVEGRAGFARAGPLLVQGRQGPERRRAAQQLAGDLRWVDVDPGHRGRRLAGPVVLPHVHARSARLQLVQPRCHRLLRPHADLLVRPRRRGHPRRRRAGARQASRPARLPPAPPGLTDAQAWGLNDLRPLPPLGSRSCGSTGGR